MRTNILKKNSTKSERIMYEILKELRLPFKHRWTIAGREIDFLVGNICIEIDGHEQDIDKNNLLVSLGYSPIHIHNNELIADRTKVKKLIYDYSTQFATRSS